MRAHSLSDAVYCIQAQMENKTYKNQKIGVVKEDIPGLVNQYTKGEFVIYTPYLYSTICSKRARFGTVESPLEKEKINENIRNNNFITSIRTMCDVPLEKYIQPISFPKEISTLIFKNSN